MDADYEAAKLVAPYGDDALVSALTAEMVESHRVFQIYRVSDDDAAHVAQLLEWFDPAPGAVVLDAGCGIGEVSKYMQACRPDISFVSLNISPAQLSYFDGPRVAADFHDLPIKSRSMDAVMFAYSLGHGMLTTLFSEASRVTKPGGVLFIYDLASIDSVALIQALGYKAHKPGAVIREAVRSGFACDLAFTPNKASAESFFNLMDRNTFARVFSGVVPAVYRFIRE